MKIVSTWSCLLRLIRDILSLAWRRTTDRRLIPVVNLVVWLVAIGLLATVAAVTGGRLVGVVGALLVADTPLVAGASRWRWAWA